jgi:hypothetical protein
MVHKHLRSDMLTIGSFRLILAAVRSRIDFEWESQGCKSLHVCDFFHYTSISRLAKAP